MRIEYIKTLPAQTQKLGLQQIKMEKLGKVVLIAGPNGSGKSRLLQLIGMQQDGIKTLYNQHLREIDKEVRKSDPNAEGSTDEHALIRTEYIVFKGIGEIVSYVPTVGLDDANALPKTQFLGQASAVSSPGMGKLKQGTLAVIQLAQDRFYNTSHAFSNASENEKEEASENYAQLRVAIKNFLRADLGRNADGNATLFGKLLGEAKLSKGQEVLLQFCVALHVQKVSLANLVLLMDEPENHLHPAALNYVLDRLIEVVTHGQIWIATHSINVLAHFDNPTIYYMDHGGVSYAGNVPEMVLTGLLGYEDEREKLANFLALPFEMSSTRFAYESLLGPAVVMTGGDDSQLKQIQTALRQVHESQGTVRILDYGAGRGRLIATIDEMVAGDEKERPVSWLDYVAFEPYDTYAVECQANIARAYGEADGRYFSDLVALRKCCHDESFDVVLLTNVFHEIPPQQWSKVLRGIAQLLKPEGQLLVVEDQRLPHGERAHEYGFLLLDTLEFRKLFAISAHDEAQNLYVVRSESGGRLKAHYFKRELLGRITPNTKRLALEELQANAKHEISRLRARPEAEHSFKNGKLHALWMNQYANAQLALEEL